MRGTDATIQSKRIIKVRQILTRNNAIKENSKSVRGTNATIQSKRIIKVCEELTQQSSQRES